MKVYVAAKAERRVFIRSMRDKLWSMGYQVLSTWIDEVKIPAGMDIDTFNKKLAIKDLCEVYAADIVIQDTHMPAGSGGSAVEYGFALGRFQDKQVFVVGPQRNVFHMLCDKHFSYWAECLQYMEHLRGEYAIHP